MLEKNMYNVARNFFIDDKDFSDVQVINYFKLLKAIFEFNKDDCNRYGKEFSLKELDDTIYSTLKEREIVYLRAYFGLDTQNRKTLQEIGEEYGCSKEWVRQKIHKAFDKLYFKRYKFCHELYNRFKQEENLILIKLPKKLYIKLCNLNITTITDFLKAYNNSQGQIKGLSNRELKNIWALIYKSRNNIESDLNICELNLTQKTCNALIRNGIFTLSDIYKLSTSDLENLPRLGKNGLIELYSKCVNFKFNDTTSCDRLVNRVDFSTKTYNVLIKHNVKTMDELMEFVNDDFGKIRGLGQNGINEIINACLKEFKYNGNENILFLNLSSRSYNALRRAGIKTVKELFELSYKDLDNIRCLGKFCVAEITSKLLEYSENFNK